MSPHKKTLRPFVERDGGINERILVMLVLVIISIAEKRDGDSKVVAV